MGAFQNACYQKNVHAADRSAINKDGWRFKRKTWQHLNMKTSLMLARGQRNWSQQRAVSGERHSGWNALKKASEGADAWLKVQSVLCFIHSGICRIYLK